MNSQSMGLIHLDHIGNVWLIFRAFTSLTTDDSRGKPFTATSLNEALEIDQ
jgi:hypothetical protein